MAWKEVVLCLGGLNPLCWTGCASAQKPEWITNPSSGTVVGESDCIPDNVGFSRDMASKLARRDVLMKKGCAREETIAGEDGSTRRIVKVSGDLSFPTDSYYEPCKTLDGLKGIRAYFVYSSVHVRCNRNE